MHRHCGYEWHRVGLSLLPSFLFAEEKSLTKEPPKPTNQDTSIACSHYSLPSAEVASILPACSAFSASALRSSSGRIHLRKAIVIRLPPAI